MARSIIGAEKVARTLASFLPWLVRIDVTLEPREINGQPGAIFRDRDHKVLFTLTLDEHRRADPDDPLGEQPRQAQARGGPVADAWATAREVNQARLRTD